MKSLRAIALLSLFLVSVDLGAQERAATTFAGSSTGATVLESGNTVARADSLYLAHDPEAALDLLTAHLAVDSTNADVLWRAARASVVIGLGVEGSREQNRWFDPAIVWSRRAAGAGPDALDGHYWYGVAAGRRAKNAGTEYAIELAQVVYDQAHHILEVDSLHGGAHNILGKLNYEVMSLSRIKRFIARTFMGNDALDDMRWENAEHHLSEAARAWPGVVAFHHDLALLHRKRGRRDEAIVEFRTVLSLPPIHPGDEVLKAEARAQLEEWGDQLDDVELEISDGSTDR